MPKPLIVNLPYPTTENLCPDAYSLNIISPAYASSASELNTILQYVYHSFFFEKSGYKDIADTLMSIAVAEMGHLELLGKTILALGAPPVYARYPSSGFNFYSAKYISYSSNLRFMLEDDIAGERYAISAYLNMAKRLCNQTVKDIIIRITEDEKLHLETLKEILNSFKG